MKTTLLFIALFISVTILSCHKPPITPPDNNDTIDTVKPPVGVTPNFLTEYSWKECKYYIRRSDSSLFDYSYFYLSDSCDTTIFTYNSDNKYFEQSICNTNTTPQYWYFSDDYAFLSYSPNPGEFDPDYGLYKIELLNKDTLKLSIVNTDNPDASTGNMLIFYYSIPKISYNK